jgi:hypothetical protein
MAQRHISLSHLTPMEVTEELSSLEVATAEDPAPEGGAGGYPAPSVLLVVIWLWWVARAATQPPRVFRQALLPIPPWMSTSGRPHLGSTGQ